MEQELIKPGADTNDVTFGEWFLTLFLVAIPLVGIFFLFVWAFGATTNPSKANWAKASLVWAAIWIGGALLLTLILGMGSRY